MLIPLLQTCTHDKTLALKCLLLSCHTHQMILTLFLQWWNKLLSDQRAQVTIIFSLNDCNCPLTLSAFWLALPLRVRKTVVVFNLPQIFYSSPHCAVSLSLTSFRSQQPPLVPFLSTKELTASSHLTLHLQALPQQSILLLTPRERPSLLHLLLLRSEILYSPDPLPHFLKALFRFLCIDPAVSDMLNVSCVSALHPDPCAPPPVPMHFLLNRRHKITVNSFKIY